MPHRIKHIACIADITPKAQEAYRELKRHYDFIDFEKEPEKASMILVLGGDGFMLETLHRTMLYELPVYGMNCGTVGFLMNNFRIEGLHERIVNSKTALLYPLKMFARAQDGKECRALAINEVSLLRETRQAAKIRVLVDHVVRISEMICDGVMVSTPAGSTAYNYSAGGPIIPLMSNVLAITPISVFRPRRWPGALVPHTATMSFEILEPHKRRVSVTADFTEVRDVSHVEVSEDSSAPIHLLFDPEMNLDERMRKEQFMLGG